MKQITIGQRRFVASTRALVNTLFTGPTTADGIFAVKRNAVLFSTPSGEPFAALIANPGQSRFFVSCSRCPASGNRIRYLFGLSEQDKRRLGVADMRHIEESETADRIWQDITRN